MARHYSISVPHDTYVALRKRAEAERMSVRRLLETHLNPVLGLPPPAPRFQLQSKCKVGR